jgi:hypothetical protein
MIVLAAIGLTACQDSLTPLASSTLGSGIGTPNECNMDTLKHHCENVLSVDPGSAGTDTTVIAVRRR